MVPDSMANDVETISEKIIAVRDRWHTKTFALVPGWVSPK